MADVLSFAALAKAAAEARLKHRWGDGWTDTPRRPERWMCAGCEWRGDDYVSHQDAAVVAAVLALLADDADALDIPEHELTLTDYADRLRGLIP